MLLLTFNLSLTLHLPLNNCKRLIIFLKTCDSSSVSCSLSLCNLYMAICLSLLMSWFSFNILDNNALSYHCLYTHITYCFNFTVIKK